MASDKKPELGDVIEAYCPVCRINLDASVAAVVAGRVEKAQCRTCGNFHPYKPPIDESDRRKAGIKRALNMRKKRMQHVPETTIKRGGRVVTTTARPVGSSSMSKPPVSAVNPDGENKPAKKNVAAQSEWERLTDGVSSTQATIYRESRRYCVGDYLIHKGMGLGYVQDLQEVDGEKWAVVIFREKNETIPVERPFEY
jgi:hypothetical protein